MAERLGVFGWIRNHGSGTAVEGEAEAEASAVDAFLAWAAKGPPCANVERLDVVDLKLGLGLDRFEIRR